MIKDKSKCNHYGKPLYCRESRPIFTFLKFFSIHYSFSRLENSNHVLFQAIYIGLDHKFRENVKEPVKSFVGMFRKMKISLYDN